MERLVNDGKLLQYPFYWVAGPFYSKSLKSSHDKLTRHRFRRLHVDKSEERKIEGEKEIATVLLNVVKLYDYSCEQGYSFNDPFRIETNQ